ncbi:CoA-binding protein [Streptococcaceae bacterium ESL0687]|nr:CoA-binding protein [Streptococcaceae bacterium ESL0687]
MSFEFRNPENQVIDQYLKDAKVIAVVGLSSDEGKASNRVARFLQEHGYKIVPVNPRFAGEEILGQKVYASLKDIPFHVDIVDVFRRSDLLSEVAHDFLQTDADVFWAQLGLQNEEAEQILRSSKREKIVMNRCTKIELARMEEESNLEM